jgi:hypothetical protein
MLVLESYKISNRGWELDLSSNPSAEEELIWEHFLSHRNSPYRDTQSNRGRLKLLGKMHNVEVTFVNGVKGNLS